MVLESNSHDLPVSDRITKVRKEIMRSLGFRTQTELSEQSSVDKATISRLFQGKTKRIEDNTACKLIEAIYKQNIKEGYSVTECANLLYSVLEYAWNHCAHFTQTSVPFNQVVPESNVVKWFELAQSKLFPIVVASECCLYKFVRTESGQENLRQIIQFADSWSIKHDFCYQDKIEIEIRYHSDFIRQVTRQAMQENLYDLLKQMFSRMQYALHLCGEFELVIDVSRWLLEKSIKHHDSAMYLRAKVMLAWTLTSSRDKSNYREAEGLIQESCRLVEQSDDLGSLCLDDMDILAVLGELIIRLPLRIQKDGGRCIDSEQFDNLYNQAEQILSKIDSLHNCPRNLEIRYKIPLEYQKGIYHFLREDYMNALLHFQCVAEDANLIGWQRVKL
jgi:DNA-binding Xre family transcriptional regulator